MSRGARPLDLPDFDDPPVDEVVIGIMFMPVGGTTTNHIAKYRESVKHELPGLQYQPRVPVQLESFTRDALGLASGLSPSVLSQLTQPAQRTWLVSANDERVVQIQDDLFLSNWRHRSDPYPRFEPLMESFWSRFGLFRMQLQEDMIIPLQLQQLEVAYVNWVPLDTMKPSEWFGPAQRSHVDLPGDTLHPEHQAWSGSFLIADEDVPVARLHMKQFEAMRTGPANPHLGSQFDLNFRAPIPPGATDDDINELAYRGREVIVRAFTSLTTTEAHDAWGRTR